jgi:gliding motility-associated-like protein
MTVATTGSASMCYGMSTSLCAIPTGGTGGNVYLWMPGNFSSPCITVSPSSTTIYTVSVIDNCGTTATTTATVHINPLPVVGFAANLYQGCTPLCLQFYNTTTFSQGTATSYLWAFGNGDTLQAQSPAYCYANSGKYNVSLTVTSDSGCSSTLTKNGIISAYAKPTAGFTFSPQAVSMLMPTVQFTNTSSGSGAGSVVAWNWNFGDATDSVSNKSNPSHTYQDTGRFCASMVVMDAHGCRDTATNCLVVDPAFNLYIPSAFSPNGDGKNETFQPKGEYIKSFEMYIFDRWGMQLYHTTDITKGWNGIAGGGSNIAQEDTYVYKILVTDSQNKQHSYVGNVTLIK